jgi:hypothetical protein
MEILPVEAQLFHVETQAGMTKLTFDFRNSASAPKGFIKSMQKFNKELRLGKMYWKQLMFSSSRTALCHTIIPDRFCKILKYSVWYFALVT